jgi:microcystin-dependent protein
MLTSIMTALMETSPVFFLPTGFIFYWPDTVPPDGAIEANGAVLLRSEQPNLWAKTQVRNNLVTDAVWLAGRFGAYSTGDGSTTFRVPDLRGRDIIGAGQGSGLSSRALGTVGGAETCALTGNQNGPHVHSYSYGYGSALPLNASGGTAHTALAVTNTGSSGLGSPHNNMQPWVAVLVCIKL